MSDQHITYKPTCAGCGEQLFDGYHCGVFLHASGVCSSTPLPRLNEMKINRYEIEPRPLPTGGGWRIRFFGKDLETGQEIGMGGGVFPIQDGQDEKDAYSDAIQTGQEWLQAQEEDQ